MDLPYHLKNYKKELGNLSPQARSILEFVIANSDCNIFYGRIEQEVLLEELSVKILLSDVLRGYYDSIYSYSWKHEEELKFWELVHSKCKEEYKIYWTLANIQRSEKKAPELKELYFKAFTQHLDFVYSLEDEDLDQFYTDPETRYDFLKFEFEAKVTQWKDFEDNWGDGSYWINKFRNDQKAMGIINQMLSDKRSQINKHR